MKLVLLTNRCVKTEIHILFRLLNCMNELFWITCKYLENPGKEIMKHKYRGCHCLLSSFLLRTLYNLCKETMNMVFFCFFSGFFLLNIMCLTNKKNRTILGMYWFHLNHTLQENITIGNFPKLNLNIWIFSTILYCKKLPMSLFCVCGLGYC